MFGLARLFQHFRALLPARGAGVAVQFAVMLVPLLALAGGAVDVGNVFRIRAILTNAADAAAVGSIAQDSPAFVTSQTMFGNGTIPSGVPDATALFNANIAGLTGVPAPTVTPTIAKSGLNVTSQVSWSTTVPMTFLGIIGQGGWTISGTSKATTSLPKYLDFYLMVDVSGSMGLPSTPKGASQLMQVNMDMSNVYAGGCVFACHFPGYTGYALSRSGGVPGNPQVSTCPIADTSACIQLRTDAVGSAIQQLLQTAQTTETTTNQYRIGLYPFIANLESYFPLTANIAATGASSLSNAAATITNLLDTGNNSVLGSGGTHFDNAFPAMNQIISNVGTGATQSSPLPFVFLITDGSQDNQYQWGGSWWGSNNATAMDPSLCSQLKTRGITISVLYIPYLPIPNPQPTFNGEDYAANAAIPSIPPALTSCASSGFFFTANTPADITSALNAMFNQAVASARITN